MKIALAQANFTVGDIAGNAAKIREWWQRGETEGAELVIFPEMALTGYPPEDLTLRQSFRTAAWDALEELRAYSAERSCDAVIGCLGMREERPTNRLALLGQGKFLHLQDKVALPNYGVFDEKRLFRKGETPQPVEWRGTRLGFLICEDLWQPRLPAHLAAEGAELLIAINVSPYETGKAGRRRDTAKKLATAHRLPLIYVNLAAGQDELVFDGGSFVMNGSGKRPVMLPRFEEKLYVTEWERTEKSGWQCRSEYRATPMGDEETIYRAMVLGLKDYVEKSGFPGILLGLSGGIDSALSAAVAVDALGKERVHSFFLPSPYSSAESAEDAEACAQMLGISYATLPIAPAMQAMEEILASAFAGLPADVTEENIQARLRGNLLMAISNKKGWMLLTTGNKSEMSVGYATLYGDMCGGFSVLKDVYKTTIFGLSRWRNAHRPADALGPQGPVMPERVIVKPPSAELRPNQTDQDSLPPYDVLDAILLRLIEQQLPVADILAEGFDEATVRRIVSLLYRAEYKRRQAPPGVKISGMSFGRDRRYPIVNKFSG